MTTAAEEIGNMVATFGNSIPVFTGSLNPDKNRIELTLKKKYDPETNISLDENDPLKQLVCNNYREDFSHDDGQFHTEIRVQYIYGGLMGTIRSFYLETSKLKNPKQSGLYKWLSNIQEQYNTELSGGFISLYRYVHSITARQKDNAHVQNVHAILDLMMEKHARN